MHPLARQTVALLAVFMFTIPMGLAQDFPRTSPGRLGFDEERIERLDQILDSYVDEQRIAGSVTLVLRDGRLAYSSARGMRDLEAGTEMTEDSIFRIASQTKAIVSTAIMMLQERGQLLITAPLSKYLPEWAEAQVAKATDDGSYELVPLERPITLRDLLTHTSGISYGNGGPAAEAWAEAGIQGWYFADRNEPIRETVAAMAELPLQAQPGEQWIYGYSTDVLGAVVEEVSGRSLADFLQEEVFTPLHMEDTHFYLPQEKAERLAVVYTPADNGGLEPVPQQGGMHSQGSYVNGPRTSYSGGAGLLSTAHDYARFLQMLLNEGELDGARLLSPKTVELMVSDHLGPLAFQPGVGFGLGFSVVTDLGRRGLLGSEGEFGWGGAYHSTYWVDPEESLVVVHLTQTLAAPGLDDAEKLRAGVYQALVN